jgi:hypothetical protein
VLAELLLGLFRGSHPKCASYSNPQFHAFSKVRSTELAAARLLTCTPLDLMESRLIVGGAAVVVPLVVVPAARSTLGFGAAGVTAGSAAAAYQSTLGGVVAAGNVFAKASSTGAAGPSSAGVAVAAVGGGVAGAGVGAKVLRVEDCDDVVRKVCSRPMQRSDSFCGWQCVLAFR